MTLSEKHRSSLYQSFVPLLGEEVAEAFIAEFPSRDGDEPITREFLRAEMAELRREMAELRADLLVRMTAILIAVISVATIIVSGVVIATR
jgi:uncharacterized protein YceH (UPF0502 family)